MKKILAFVLTLAMMLTMLNVGFVASAADEIPAGAIAISTADQLAGMEAGNYYYLTADIIIGTPGELTEDESGTPIQDDWAVPAEEAEMITIPAGVTLDGNGYTIYHGYYIKNPGMYTSSNKYVNSLNWTHSLFELSAGDTITLKNLKIGDEETPVYMSKYNEIGATGDLSKNDIWGVFDDTAESNVVWNNVDIYAERYGRGLGGYNTAVYMFKSLGNHTFTDCTMNTSTLSAGSQAGGWIYNVASGSITMTNCSVEGFVISAGFEDVLGEDGETVVGQKEVFLTPAIMGSYVGGFFNYAYTNITMTNCVNNVNISASYGSTGGHWSGLVNNFQKGALYMEGCVNNGNISIGGLTIGGAIVGRTGGASAITSFRLINCVNNGKITRGTGVAGLTSNHGYGAIAGHTASDGVYEVIGCVNNGNMTGATGNVGGIVGFAEGTATKVIQNCVNNGNITTNSAYKDLGGIIGQARNESQIENCMNFGDIVGGSGDYATGGILGEAATNTGVTIALTGCANYGNVGSASQPYVGGMIGSANLAVTFNLTNCVNYGAILGTNYVGGMISRVSAADAVTLQNCKNFGAIGTTATVRAGGMIGNINVNKTYTLTGCENYGKITSKQYSAGMIAELQSTATITINTSKNFGEIAGVHAVAGFIGQTANGASTITISRSLNAGAVHQSSAPGEGIGGFFGRVAGTKPTLQLTACVNIGTITGSTKATTAYGAFGDTFGQFIGAYTVNAARNYSGTDVDTPELVGGFYNWSAEGVVKPNLNRCYAFGIANPAEGAKSLKGWITAEYTTDADTGDQVISALTQDTFTLNDVPVTEAPNNGVVGINVEYTGTVYFADTLTGSQTVASVVSQFCGVDVVAGNTEQGDDAYVLAAPEIRGYQQSTDGSDIRFLAAVYGSNFEAVGFKYSVEVDGELVVENAIGTVSYVMKAINARGEDGSIESKTAADLGAKYISAITFKNVSATSTYKITVAPMADSYTGASQTVTIVNGVVQ